MADENGNPNNAELAQRLEDMARVAGRVAHDFDNILTGVLGFTELTQTAVPAGPAHRHLAELYRVGQQGVELTKRLHLLSRAAGAKPVAMPLAGILADAERRRRKRLPEKVALEVQPALGLPPVMIDAEAIRSALDELLANAVEACADGGKVVVSAETVTLSDADCRQLLGRAAAGEFVLVTVADSGAGFSPQARARLFVEACFSTKPRHRGLGLPIVYRVLYSHHAGLLLDTDTQGGTVARVFLPVAVADKN